MTALVQFIARISFLLYALCAIGMIFAVRGVLRARRTRRITIYALEREAAAAGQRRSLNTIIILLLLAGAIYVNNNILQPNLAGGDVQQGEPTPAVIVEPQPTPTVLQLLYPTITPTIALAPNSPDAGSQPSADTDGCEIIGSTLTTPKPGDAVSGLVRVEGEANVLNFAQYKFEVSGAGTGGAWVVVGTYNSAVPQGFLGTWDATSLQPGSYVLRLVTIRTDGTYLAPCEIPVTVTSGGAEAGTDTDG